MLLSSRLPRRALRAGLLVTLAACGPCLRAAEPYTPTNRATVLLQRGPRAGPATPADAAGTPDASAADPRRAVARARAAIDRGRATGDSREFGQAQAWLGPWWRVAAPPPEIQLLRATLRQQRHDFAGALADLDALLVRQPANAQAHLTRAAVLMATGRAAAARGDCQTLLGQAGVLTFTACLSAVGTLTGRQAASIQALAQILALPQSAAAPPAERGWARTVLAEALEARGDAAGARAAYAAALADARAGGGPDPYLLAAVADFRLAQGQPEELPALLAPYTANDGLLLRLALAEDALAARGDAPARARRGALLGELQERQAIARARGEAFHAREEGRTALVLEAAPVRALALAQANWQSQREPADALLLLQAARAAGQPAAAAPVRAWMRATGIEDRRLAAADAALGAS